MVVEWEKQTGRQMRVESTEWKWDKKKRKKGRKEYRKGTERAM